MRCLFYLPALLLLTVPGAGAQHTQDLAERRIIDFPDVPGYHTLTCDLHTHTVFSDGSVWPDIRVQEALRDGLDCLAITDHIEYQPHIEDIPHPDRNRSYEEAVRVLNNMMEDEEEANQEENEESLLILRGAEITRSMPPGHLNAVLLEDVNPVKVDDATEAIREANRQGAFVFWNHPSWPAQKPDAIAELTDMHRQLIDEGLFHGIEVVNEFWYSDEALQIALDHNLAILGTSDIHGLVDWEYDVPGGGHRPVTLVFAADRSLEGIGEALRMRRTAVWYKDILIGRPEHVQPLIEASLSVQTAEYEEKHFRAPRSHRKHIRCAIYAAQPVGIHLRCRDGPDCRQAACRYMAACKNRRTGVSIRARFRGAQCGDGALHASRMGIDHRGGRDEGKRGGRGISDSEPASDRWRS